MWKELSIALFRDITDRKACVKPLLGRAVFVCFLITGVSFLTFGQESGAPLPAAQPEAQTVEKPPRIDAFRSVNGLEQWKYDYDISKHPAGKYNLIIQGTDRAGNIYTEGPYNIIIDPDSDLPITNISNPTPNLRVGGNLNIVGTCVDDDAVASVQVSINDGPFIEAEGTDFWSYDLNTTDLLDGLYTITAKGTDINGVEGKDKSVVFNLDRYKPVFEITSHQNGDLVNGRIDLKGTVTDKNGIAAVSYSSDGGETYQPLSFKSNKQAVTAEFSLKIDTKLLPDGAQIYWFEGRDKMGSVERTAFLFFVDNKPPQLIFLYPVEDDDVNGVFTVSGKVVDEVGVARLTWQIDKEAPVEIPLRPGDPYWAQEFDYSGAKNAEVLFTLIDKTGNTTEERFKRELSFDADLPVLTLTMPVQDASTDVDRIAGFLRDDDGVRGIIYSFDGGEELSVETGQAFNITLSEALTPGVHRLALRAVDINGLEGLETEVSFTKVGGAPEITIATVTDSAGGTTPFDNGIEIRTDVHKSISGSIVFQNPAGPATFSLAGSEKQPLPLKRDGVSGAQGFTIPIPPEAIPFGIVELLIETTDEYGLTGQKLSYFFAKNLTRNDEEHGIYFFDARIERGSSIRIDRTSPLLGRYIGYPAAKVELDPPTDIVSIRESNGVIEITPVKDGVTAATSVKVKSDRGTVFTAGPFIFNTDTTPPELKLDASLSSGRPGSAMRLKGTVSDAVGGVSASYSLGGEELSIQISNGAFDGPLSFGSLPEQGVLLKVRAIDDAGNSAVAYRVFNRFPRFTPDPAAKKDPAPVVTVLYPAAGAVLMPEDLVNARVYSGGVVSGVERVAELYYTLDRGEERSTAAADAFEMLFPDLQPGAHSISFKAVSDKGVSGQSSRIDFQIAPPAPRARFTGVKIGEAAPVDFAPGADLPIAAGSSLLGTITGGASLSGTYSVDGGEPAKLSITLGEGGDSAFSIPLDRIAGFGRHEISLSIVGSLKRTFDLSTFYHRVVPKGSRQITERDGLFVADPRFSGAGQTILMRIGETVAVLFSGREIKSYNLENETGIIGLRREKNILFMTATADGVMKDAALLVTTVDGEEYSTPRFSVRVDGDAPVIKLDRDITGEWVRDSLVFGGTVTDNIAVFDISVAIGGQVVLKPPVSGGKGPGPLPETKFSINLPFSEVPEGDVTISITASDEAGHKTVQEYLLRHDSTPPAVRQITPELSVTVNGLLTFSGLASDDGNIESVEFSGDGVEFLPVTGTSLFNGELDLNRYSGTIKSIVYRVTDQAGNVELYTPALNIDPESDKPVVQMQIPTDGTLIRTDFLISGMVFDDDDVKTVYYRIDDGEYIALEGGNNFEIEFKLADLADNRHTVEVKAEDLAGVQSEVAGMWFNVSTSEPRSLLLSPQISETVKGMVLIRGESVDLNGIESVFISFDNGNTFNRAEGREKWVYSLDTRTLPDGTYSLLIKAIDAFGVDGLYTTLLNIDNTLPTLELTGFMDREPFAGVLNVRGRVADSIGLETVHIDVLPVIGDPHFPTTSANEKSTAGEKSTGAPKAVDYAAMFAKGPPVISVVLPPEEVVLENLDLSRLPPGLYNLQITATDRAANTAYISRNFEKIESVQLSTIEIMFPAQGERLSGEFSLQGRIITPEPPQRAALYVDGELFEALEVTQYGFYSITITPERFTEGSHSVMVEAKLPTGEVIQTDEKVIDYAKTGPWIVIDTFGVGDFASNRPWIEGRAGYIPESIPEDEREAKALLKALEVARIEYSINNGKSFTLIDGGEEWKFRLETQNLQDGVLNLLVRARYRNNSSAVAKTQIILDDTPPTVKLIFPEEGMRFNEKISLSGTAFDANGLTDVTVALRKGDKSQYAVPSFIQGLFLDVHFLGGTYFEGGAGLTFFDDNVKLSVFAGTSPPGGRFSGTVFGAKLLANIATLPYGYFFGPDWEFLSSSVAIGADFSLFTMEASENEEARAIVLGAVVAQVEIARVKIVQWDIFSAFSAYIEGQFWFISSDIEGGIKPKIAFGIRSNVF